MKTIIFFLLLTFSIRAQVDSTDWNVLVAIEISLKYLDDENISYDLLYRSPEMMLQQTLEYLERKKRDIEYLKLLRGWYIEKLRKQYPYNNFYEQ